MKKKPLTFSEYQSGRRLYKAVYLEKFLTAVQPMFTYANDIFTFANIGLDWLSYDEAFRRGRENFKYPWDTTRPDLERKLGIGGNRFCAPCFHFSNRSNFHVGFEQSYQNPSNEQKSGQSYPFSRYENDHFITRRRE